MSESSPSTGKTPPRLQRLLGPRPILLGAFATLLVALLATLAYVIISSQQQSRRQAEQRFETQSALSAQLTSSLLQASVPASEAAAARSFGSPRISRSRIDAYAAGARAIYVFILDHNGRAIASTTGAAARAREPHLDSEAHVRSALAGIATFSDVLPDAQGAGAPLLEWAIPFNTPFGRRVQIQAVPATAVSQFLGGLLSKARQEEKALAFVLDDRDHVLAVGGGNRNTTAETGSVPKQPELLRSLIAHTRGTYTHAGTQYFYSSTAVLGSTWRVVLAVPTGSLYSPLSGSKRWVLYAVLVAFALAGIACLMLFLRALSSGQRLALANDELRTVNMRLEDRVAERTAALEERATELARSNAELEQFSSAASHDLQEPLRKIRMFGDRLRDRLGDDLPEEPREDLERMKNAAARMQRLINDLLDFSRVTHRGKDFERVDLSAIANDVVSDLEARVLELDARIDVGDLPVIDADRTQMHQLLQNLVGNALKFHHEGKPPVVKISSEFVDGHTPRFPGETAAGKRCVITITDNGIGFDDKHAERVFTAFERLHGRSTYEGTGIGLSIARKIAWRHGGHITASGVPGQGATFTVTLPISQSNGHDGGEPA